MIKSGTEPLKQEYVKPSVLSVIHISNIGVNGMIGKGMK